VRRSTFYYYHYYYYYYYYYYWNLLLLLLLLLEFDIIITTTTRSCYYYYYYYWNFSSSVHCRVISFFINETHKKISSRRNVHGCHTFVANVTKAESTCSRALNRKAAGSGRGQGDGHLRSPPSWQNPIVQELCESRGGRPGLSVLTSLLVSVDVKIY